VGPEKIVFSVLNRAFHYLVVSSGRTAFLLAFVYMEIYVAKVGHACSFEVVMDLGTVG